jgi:hypothetical protein
VHPDELGILVVHHEDPSSPRGTIGLGWPCSRWLSAVAATALAALALAAIAVADKERVQLTPAGQADARAVVVTRADLGTASWTGGTKKPNLSVTFPVCNYKPKQSDLVLIGAAESDWKSSGVEIDNQVNVLQTPAMVGLDWQRTVVAPQVLPCLRARMSTYLTPSERLVSFRRISFPNLTPYSRAYRAIVDYKAATGTVPVLVDVILVGRGRTEITLTTTAISVADSIISAAELRLAQVLISRIHA